MASYNDEVPDKTGPYAPYADTHESIYEAFRLLSKFTDPEGDRSFPLGALENMLGGVGKIAESFFSDFLSKGRLDAFAYKIVAAVAIAVVSVAALATRTVEFAFLATKAGAEVATSSITKGIKETYNQMFPSKSESGNDNGESRPLNNPGPKK